ncbi:hypothetical protein CUR178_07359 [Leishmania enriettii]|uniref:Uncharacterized protein n=1 Tax=Leishmania enriettii TaxID=5663 RepID=A0A836HMQ7_LEIEN|nr:hypothetical protein CUR178_07359 [Leishmania enriettii]
MNPLDYLSPDVFTRTWGAPTRVVHSLGSHICVVGPRYDRIAVASVAMEDTGRAPPQEEVVCTAHTRTFLPTPHSGSCPLDYIALFVTLYRRQSEKVTRLHASRSVPLLASESPRTRRLHATAPSAAAAWMTTRTPLPSAAAAYASQNTELDARGRHAERLATSSMRSAAPRSRSSEEGVTVVERPVPESVAAAMARVAATPMSAAAPTSPVGIVHRHQRPRRPDPQRMQYHVGRSGSTQLMPLSGSNPVTPSNTVDATPVAYTRHTEDAAPRPTARALSALSPSPTTDSSAPTSVPRASTSLISVVASPIQPSRALTISAAAVEVTARPSSTDCQHDLAFCESSFLAEKGDTPGEASMTEVQQPGWPLSWHRHQRMNGRNGAAWVDGGSAASGHDEVDARERLQHLLQHTLARQRQLEQLMFDADVGEGDARKWHQRTEEHVPHTPGAPDARQWASEGQRGRRAAGAAAPHLFRGTGIYDDTDGVRADSVVAARSLPLACAPTRHRGSSSPSPQPHDDSSRWRRESAAQRRRPQFDAAQHGPSDHQQLSPSPAAAVGEDAHRRYTASASQHTSGSSSSVPASSGTVSRSAAPPAMSASERTAHMPSSPSIRVNRDECTASLHAPLAFATAGVVDVDGTTAPPSVAMLSSSTPVYLSRRPLLPTAALTDPALSDRPPSEDVCGAECTMCPCNSNRIGPACAHPQNRVNCPNSPAVDEGHAEAVTAPAVTSGDGHRARKLESRYSTLPSASASAWTMNAQRPTHDAFAYENCNSEAHRDGVLEEDAGAVDVDTPAVRRTSPGTSDGTGKESLGRRSCSSSGAAEPQDKISTRAVTGGDGDDGRVRGHHSCRGSRLPPSSRSASLSSSSSSSLAPRHVRTDTRAGGTDMDAAFEEVEKAGGAAHIRTLAATTSPAVYLSDMLCLSFSSDDEGNDAAAAPKDAGEACHVPGGACGVAALKMQLEGEAHVVALRGRMCSDHEGHHRRSPFSLADDGDGSHLSKSAASISSSPPSQSHTAMRRVTGIEDEVMADSKVSASSLSPLTATQCRCWTTATGPSACTPHRVTARLTLSADERRLHASTASTVAWGSATSGDHRHRGAAATVPTTTSRTSASSAAPAATARLTTTPAESSTRSSVLSIFSTPAQARLQSLLQASTWSTATPCSRAKENRNFQSNSSDSGSDYHPQDPSSASTARRTSRRATEEGDDLEYKTTTGAAYQSPHRPLPMAGAAASASAMTPRDSMKRNRGNGGVSDSPGEGHEPRSLVHSGGKSGDDEHVHGGSSSSTTSTPLSALCASPAAAQASATASMTSSKAGVAEGAPASTSPLHPSPFRGAGSLLLQQRGGRNNTSAAASSGAEGDNVALSSGVGRANWLPRARGVDIQLLARATRFTHGRGGSEAAAAPKAYSPAGSPKQQPSSSPSSPMRYSTGSLSFFLAAAATSPGSEGGIRASGGGGLSEDDEGQHARAAGSGVYGSAVAQRRSWAPLKQPQDHRRRQQSYSSIGIHSPSVSAHRLSRTYSCGSCLSEALAVAPQRLTFGSAIASVSGANSTIGSTECWPAAYSAPVAVALSHPGQKRQHHAPPPPYAASPDDTLRRVEESEEAAESSRRSLLLPSNPRAASPRQSWTQSVSSPLLLSPFALRTPSGRPSLSSTELIQAPLRHGETRNRFSACSLPSTSIASAAEQRSQRLRRSSRRSPSLGSGSVGAGFHDIGGRQYPNRALSSVRHSPSSVLATPPVWAGLEYAAGVTTPLGGRIDALSPSPLNSSRQRHTSGSGRSRASALLTLQPQSVQSRASATALQLTLADELRLFASPAFSAALTQPLAPVSSYTTPPLPTTFIASPSRRTGPPTSTLAPPHPSSLLHSTHQRPSLPSELLGLMQVRSSASSAAAVATETLHDPGKATSSALAQAAQTGAMAPPYISPFPSKSVLQRGCSERREVNVDHGQQDPSTPHWRGPLSPQREGRRVRGSEFVDGGGGDVHPSAKW